MYRKTRIRTIIDLITVALLTVEVKFSYKRATVSPPSTRIV